MYKTLLVATAAAVAALATPTTQAQTAGQKEELRAAIGRALTPLIGSDSGDVVKRLLEVKPEGAISRNFNLAKAITAGFGRNPTVAGADCKVATTAAKEPDEGLCTYEFGKRDDPTAAYAMLAFSKNIGQGNIKFIKRAAFSPTSTAEPVTVKLLSDADAYKKAIDFAIALGVPASEIPVAPAGAKNALPVRSLVAGAGQERGGDVRYALFKAVTLPRAFVVPRGLLQDPATGVVLSHVIAPGAATFLINDAGVQFARIEGWSDAQLDPKLNASLAKSAAALTAEITDDLYNEGVRKVGSLSILIGLRKAYPNPDDPDSPSCPRCSVLRPSLKVMVTQVGPGKVAATTNDQSFVAPGVVREYDLVEQTEVERPSR